MAYDVFISYSSKDKIVADTIVSTLENNKIRCWYAPRDIKPGADWGKAISNAIKGSKVFLVVFSGHANKSQRVLDELNFAISNEVTILPFRIENLEPRDAMMLHLSSRHWLDAYDPSWEKHLRILTNTVTSIFEKPGGEVETGIPKIKGEKDKKQQTNNLAKIIAGIVLGVILFTVGWFGFSALNNRGSGFTTFSAAETFTPQEIPAVQGLELTETPTAIPEQPTVEPTLQNSISELGIPDYQTDFSTIGIDSNEWREIQNENGSVNLGSDGTLIVKNKESMLQRPYPERNNFVNSIIEVDAKIITKPDYGTGEISLICRASYPAGQIVGYRATFTSSGKIYIQVIPINSGGGWPIFSKMNPGLEIGRYYHLRFDCIGHTFTVYLDGSKIGEVDDNTVYAGMSGLASWGSITFDNFKLWVP